MSKISKIRTILYTSAKVLGDVDAVANGKVEKRVKRRLAGKLTGKIMNKIK